MGQSTGGQAGTHGGRRNVPRFVIVALAVLLSAAQPVLAASRTSVVIDPVGDAGFDGGPVPTYQDIVKAAVALKDGRFVFMMEVAAPIPRSPSLQAPGTNRIWWAWGIDADSTTAPVGYPSGEGKPHITEFVVAIAWDGKVFSGFLVDRRPLLSGGDVEVTSTSFGIKGAELKVSLDAARLTNPSAFRWAGLMIDWPSPPGSESLWIVDFAPDAYPFATWPM